MIQNIPSLPSFNNSCFHLTNGGLMKNNGTNRYSINKKKKRRRHGRLLDIFYKVCLTSAAIITILNIYATNNLHGENQLFKNFFSGLKSNSSKYLPSRRERVRPPLLNASLPPPPRIQFTRAGNSHLTNNNTSTKKQKLASEFCGKYAPIASKSNPQYYLKRDALLPSSKVLITGIWSNPLAFHLAKALKEYCNVNEIYGLDDDVVVNNQNWAAIERQAILERNEILTHQWVGFNDDQLKKKIHELTHIIHLEWDEETSSQVNVYERIQHSQSTIVQILNSLKNVEVKKERCNFVYVYTTRNGFEKGIKLMDEIVATTYHSLHGVYSTGLRFGTIYGPWIQALEGLTHDIIGGRNHKISLERQTLDLVYVNDAIQAILSAMQFRHKRPIVLDIKSGKEVSSTTLKEKMNSLFVNELPTDTTAKEQNLIGAIQTKAMLGWKPDTSLQHGLIEQLNWIYHRIHPIVPPPNTTIPHHLLTKSTSLTTRYPCASECSYPQNANLCTPSILDSILPISQKFTQNCKIVLYTVRSDPTKLKNPISTTTNKSKDPFQLCYIAFVSEYSSFVQAAYDHHDQKQLPSHNGWNLISLPLHKLSLELYSVVKLTPSKLFSPTTSYAFFINSDSLPPNHRIIAALIKQTHVYAKPARKVWHRKKNGKKYKTKLKAEPERRAIVFLPQMKFKDGKSLENVGMKEIVDVMLGRRSGEKFKGYVYRQGDFYDDTLKLLQSVEEGAEEEENDKKKKRNVSMQWGRSLWLIHDLRLEEGRQFRCEWYKEHIFWGNEKMEDLSFMYVLMRRYFMGKHGEVEGHDADWNPVFVDGGKHAKDVNGVKLFVRILKGRLMEV